MQNSIWLLLVVTAILLWASTNLLYKAGVHDGKEEHICLKYSVCIGIVFFVIACAFIAMRDEPFTIWESAVRYWPMTIFGPLYAVINTIAFNGYIYNEATVQSPMEDLSAGWSTLLLIFAYLALGRADSAFELLTPLRTVGIVVILLSVTRLAIVRNRISRESGQSEAWKTRGLGTLVFPLAFSMLDALETIVTGLCLDTTYGYAMPEGDGVIIIGMTYALFALGCWVYIYWKEGRPYNPFTRHSAPRILGALTDNIGIVCYGYAMAINSISTDPLIAIYPVFAMLGGRVIMKERLGAAQSICLLGIVAGSVLVVLGTVIE